MAYRYQSNRSNEGLPWGCFAVPGLIVAIIGAVIWWFYSGRFIDNRPPKPPVRVASKSEQCMYSNGSRLIVADGVAAFVPPGRCFDRINRRTGQKVGSFCEGNFWAVEDVQVPESIVKDGNGNPRHLQVISVVDGHDYTTSTRELTCVIREDSVIDAKTGDVVYTYPPK